VELIAIGYPDPVTGPFAMDELKRSDRDLGIRWDEVAVAIRDEDGAFKIFTNAVITSGAPSWAMLWWYLFATIFFVPILEMPVGSDLGTILDEVRSSGLDPLFEERIKEELSPGTSALFVLVDRMDPDIVASALDAFGGTVIEHHISKEAEAALSEALNGRTRLDSPHPTAT
jgi:uncharacterized membrane protein